MRESEMLWVDGKPIPKPSKFDWGLNDISASDAGRDQSATMYKMRIGQKRTISLSWPMPNKEEAKIILNAFNPEYFDVRYYDPLEGDFVTKNFYCGDRSAPVRIWTVGNQRYSEISFNIIER